MERLIGVLGDKLDLTAEEIADILWLGLLQWQSMAEAPTQTVDVALLVEDEQSSSALSIKPDGESTPSAPLKQASISSMVGLQPQQSDADAKGSDGLGAGHLPIALPDAPGLRDTLGLLRALKPLLRKVPSIDSHVLDEAVTAQRIAETDLWIPELQPELEPWLDLALVVDASPSMLIWQRSLRDVQRLLRQCGAFRDIRVWSLDVSSDGDVQLRPGYGSMAAQASPCSPRELIDPNGRRLVLVMSDCIDDRWQTEAISAALAIWAKHGMMALVQVLPEWLWDRTALQSVPKVRFYSLEPGTANHKLRVKRRDRWRRSSIADIKVPVLTLEPSVTQRWSQMVVGKGEAGAAGLLLARSPQATVNRPSLPPQEQVKQFHLFSSPIARRLASLLSACPIVNLPIIRMVQDAMLADSDQVHVAEVLWGSLFQPVAPIENFANPDEVEYKLQDAETRKILLGETPPADAFEILSRWINQRLGKSLDEFVAILQDPQQSEELGSQAQAFAGVAIDVLRQQGGAYTRIAERLAAQWFEEPDSESTTEWSLDTLEILEFETAQIIGPEASSDFSALHDQGAEVVPTVFDKDLQPTEFEDNALNQQLLELAIAAQRAPSNSADRHTALTQLMSLIVQPGRLQQPHRTRFSQSNYEEIYAEALATLLVYIRKGGIDKYDPQRGSVMAWVNNLMRYRVIDAGRKIIGNQSGSRGEPYASMHSLDEATFQSRLEWEAKTVPVSTSDLMRRCLEEDITGEFRRKHVENYPEASFQAIALSRLQNESWKSISARLGIPIPTLNLFFERYKPRFISQFRAYGSDYSQLSLTELNDE